jgi:hypothetical protein
MRNDELVDCLLAEVERFEESRPCAVRHLIQSIDD